MKVSLARGVEGNTLPELREQLAELTGKLEDQKRSSESMDDFISIRMRVTLNEVDIVGLIRFRNSAASSSHSIYNLSNERYPVLLFSGTAMS